MRARSLIFATLGGLACACGLFEAPEPTRPTPAEATSPIPEPPPRSEDGDACTLGPIVDLFASGGQVSIARTEREGLAVLRSDNGIVTRAIAADGSTRGEARSLAGDPPRALWGLDAIGARFLLLSAETCAESAHCIVARLFDRSGEPLGPSVAAPLPAEPTSVRRARGDDRVVVAWASAGGTRGVDVWIDAGGDLGRARHRLSEAPADPEQPTEILGAAVSGQRWAVLWRRGAMEDAASSVFLTSAEAHASVDALHHAIVVERMRYISASAPAATIREASPRAIASELAIIAAFEMSRPHALRIVPGAPSPRDDVVLEPSTPIPEPFSRSPRPRLDIDAGRVGLTVTDAAGDRVGGPLLVVEARARSATISADREPWLLAWTEPNATRARAVDCRPRD